LIDGVEEEAADMYLYRLAEKKARQIGEVTRLLKESAADCNLNIEQTNFTTEKLSKLAANQNIRIELSSKDVLSGKTREVDFMIGDLSGSEICDYMSCEFQCRPKKPDSSEENALSYNEHNLESNIYYIIGRIKELYRERHIYTLDQISTAINVVRVYPVAQIYYVLSRFVDNRNMVIFDKYGRFGYLLNRGKYYMFQPIEITDTRSSVRDRSVPVEYKRGNIILELPDRVSDKKKVVRNEPAKTGPGPVSVKDTFVPDSYEKLVKHVRGLIEIVKVPHSIKSTETDWYKNASRAIDHLTIVYGLNMERISKYTIYHYLDSATYIEKRTLFQSVIDQRVFEIDPEVEQYILSYFRASVMQSKNGMEGVYIADREETKLILRNTYSDDEEEEDTKWREGDKFDATDFKDDIAAKYIVNTRSLNDIVGYMVQFKDQDMSFYFKDIYLKRNKKGRRCDRAGGKAPIIDMLNRITNTKVYTEDTAAALMYSGSLCVVLEMILRKYHDESAPSRIFYLTPEQSIQSKITDYSASV
jgi:hypothetical protein